jgi:hypothetical protein
MIWSFLKNNSDVSFSIDDIYIERENENFIERVDCNGIRGSRGLVSL